MNMDNEDPNYTQTSLRYDQEGHTFTCVHCGTEGKQWHESHRFCTKPATCMDDYYKTTGRVKPRLL